MGFNPLDEKGIPLEKQARSWSELNVKPYTACDVHPYTRTRVILMNGIEVEAALFLHQMNRHATDMALKQQLAMTRRMEQQQQKMVNWLIPAQESVLEVTLGYEQVAVDLTAWLAKTEPDPYVKQALDFALLEDFDHLYRYANLYSLDTGQDPSEIVGDYTEIMPGRPTIAEHRHPFDSVRRHYDATTADILTKLHVCTIVAGEQQTMNYYMNSGNRYANMLGRGLYLEIAQIEEQHVSHYESLADPRMSWFEHLVMHDYNETYLYYSCLESENDPRIKQIWELMLQMEIGHLHNSIELMKKFEQRDARTMLPKEFPTLTIFESNKEYVRDVIKQQLNLTAEGTEFVPVGALPNDFRYFEYNRMVNGDKVPSQEVIREHITEKQQDYRLMTEGDYPVGALQSRTSVPDTVARTMPA
ncbi:MAG: hypothetical protein ACOYYS_09630 [Chloroflexota bacterium]